MDFLLSEELCEFRDSLHKFLSAKVTVNDLKKNLTEDEDGVLATADPNQDKFKQLSKSLNELGVFCAGVSGETGYCSRDAHSPLV